MKEIKFVDVGEGITEGHVRKWLVKDGDNVKEDQSIVQVETDKAVVNVPAPISGKVSIAAKEGTTVKVGDLVAIIGTSEELKIEPGSNAQKVAVQPETAKQEPVRSSAQQIAGAPQAKSEQSEPEHAAENEIIATPSVRKLARELGIDLKDVSGTGPSGRITENDVRGHKVSTQKKAVPKFSEVLEEKHAEEITRVPMSQTRKAIAKNMELSWTIPRATHMDIMNADALFAIVQKEKPRLEKLGIKLTFLPFIIKAVVRALKEYPRFNSSYDHESQEVIVKRYFNIGIATEAPDGLKVVVIKESESKSIAQIAKELQDLGSKIKDQSITVEEMSDSTFTITNIGSLGGGFLSVPMINYPEVAILGVHRIKDEPVVKDNAIVIGKVLPLSLSFDHRVVDGADVVEFTNSIIRYLEDPDFLEILG